MTSTFDAFLSYHSGDRPLAEELYRELTTRGFRVWFDRDILQGGDQWHAKIEAGCEASRVVLPVLTPDWQGSKWTRFETGVLPYDRTGSG